MYLRRACRHVDVGTCPHQVLVATLTLSQPRGADYAHPILVSKPSFESRRLAWTVITLPALPFYFSNSLWAIWIFKLAASFQGKWSFLEPCLAIFAGIWPLSKSFWRQQIHNYRICWPWLSCFLNYFYKLLMIIVTIFVMIFVKFLLIILWWLL